MATGGGSFSNSVIQASDAIYDFSCSPCNENRRNAEALYKCVDCQTLLCVKCYDVHLNDVRGHQIVDVEAKVGGSIVKQTQGYTCEKHNGRLIEMYCQEHDEVYCGICIIKHGSCKGVDFIPHVAQRLLQDKYKSKIKTDLISRDVELRNIKSIRLTYLNKLYQDKYKSIKEIKQFKEKLIKKVEELEKSALTEVEKRYRTLTDDVKLDVQKIDQLMIDVEKYLSKIEEDKYDDETDEVVTLKLSQQHLNTIDNGLNGQEWKIEKKIDFRINATLKKCLHNERFGEISGRTLNYVNIYASRTTKRYSKDTVKPRLLDVGIYSDIITSFEETEDDGLTVCVVENSYELPNLNDDTKQNRRTKRHCIIFMALPIFSILRMLKSPDREGRVTKREGVSCAYVYYNDQNISDVIQMIKDTLNE